MLRLVAVTVAVATAAGVVGWRVLNDVADRRDGEAVQETVTASPGSTQPLGDGASTTVEVATGPAGGTSATTDALTTGTGEQTVAPAPPQADEFGDGPLATIEGVGSIARGTTEVGDPSALRVSAVEWVGDLPEGVLAVGAGLHVDVEQPDIAGLFEVRLQLPASPRSDAVPGVLHVADDGSVTIESGTWDSQSNSIVVYTASFSDRFGGWWNPLHWGEEVIQVGQGVFDEVADWATGRTDPPACRNDAPSWASLTTNELSSVHVCLQANHLDDGTEVVEVYLKSNRNLAQLITVPAGAAYLWVEEQPVHLRPMLAALAGGSRNDILLPGGASMSFAYVRPEGADLDVEVGAYLTGRLGAVNQVLGLIGNVPLKGVLAMASVVYTCFVSFSGLDVSSGDIFFDEDLNVSFEDLAMCALETVANPDMRFGMIDLVLTNAGMSVIDRNALLGQWHEALESLGSKVSWALRALSVAQVGTHTFDAIFDNLAEGWLTLHMVATPRPPDVADQVIRAGDSTSWYVDADGVRHHIPDGGIYLCLTAWKGKRVTDVAHELASLMPEGDAATCRVDEAANHVLHEADNTSWYVDANLVRHEIPDGGTYECLVARGNTVIEVSHEQVEAIAAGDDASCSPDMPDIVIRIENGQSWYVDGNNVRHPIPNGGTFLCLTAWKGKSLVNVLPEQADLLSEGDPATCRVDEAANHIIRKADGTAYFVDGNLVRHHIPDGGTYECLVNSGVPVIDNVTADQVEAIEAGDDATCVPPVEAPSVPDRVIRIADGTSWYVDAGNVRHHIPNGGTYICLTVWRQKAVVEVSPEQAGVLPEADAASCRVDEAANRVLRQSDGTSWFVDGDLTRHHIRTGGAYNCLVSVRGTPVIDNLTPQHLEALPNGDGALCTALLVGPDGTSFYVDGSDHRVWVPDGGIFQCLEQRGATVVRYDNWDVINLFPEDTNRWASCP